MDDFEMLQAKYVARVQQRAEEKLRSLIHREYMRRVGLMMRTLKGSPLSRSARMREARRRTGIAHDEVYGGELSVEAALMISTPADAGRYLSESDQDALGGTIFGGLRILQIGESAVASAIVDARDGVKKSRKLLRAEEAAERESESAAQDSGRSMDTAIQILARRSRRRTFGRLRTNRT